MLGTYLLIPQALVGLGLTSADASNHKTMDSGRATMYRILPVKLARRKKFPVKPHASEMALRTISLGKREHHNSGTQRY